MTGAEKILRAKTDLDDVFRAGFELGKSEGAADESFVDAFIEGRITDLENSTAKKVGSYVFRDYQNLRNVRLNAVTELEVSAFQGCPLLTSAQFPEVTHVGSRAFFGCNNLSEIVFSSLSYLDSQSFHGCTSLKALVIDSNSVAVLTNVNAFASSSVANGTGYIYVHDALVDAYKSSTNWSTYSSQIRAVSQLEEDSL